MSQLIYRFTTSVTTDRGSTAKGQGMLTQAIVDANYPSGNTLNGLVQQKGQGWQRFVVPKSNNYFFEVVGAPGGDNGVIGTSQYKAGGRGAKILGFLSLQSGDILYILVGQQGWGNVNFADWGGGGGGASAIFRVNPGGNFTFAPDSVKVEALVVAGAGGGAADNVYTTQPGQDAILTNGPNTNGGTSSTAVGGAGLTGASSSGWVSGVPAILSGNGVASTQAVGGFGGGGAGYNGGGGAGGYSGGNATDTTGGRGGTSFVNATYIQNETRELDTYGTKHGYVLLTGGRNPEKKILALDSEGYKYFDETSWVLINSTDPFTEPTYQIFDTFGENDITNVTGLNDSTKFLVKSDSDNDTLDFAGLSQHQVVKPKFDVDTATVENIKSITATTTGTGATVKLAVSTNRGITWQVYSQGAWATVDINDKNDFATNGMEVADFNNITEAQWGEILSKHIRFAMIFEQLTTTNNLIVDEINMVVDYQPIWRKALPVTDYSYEYPFSDILKITILTNQDGVKINYIDKG